jgi:hypothetical protein
MNKTYLSTALASAILAAAGSSLPAFAGVTQVLTPSTLAADSSVSLGSLGSSGTIVASGSTATTSTGSTVTFLASTSLYAVEQGTSWSGNFLPGDDLLYSYGNTSITIDPSVLVQGAGLQIQSSALGTYYAQVSAYDGTGALLGSVTGSGSSTRSADGSALYLGLTSTSFDIDKLVVQLLSPTLKLNKFSIGNIGLVEGSSSVRLAGSPSGGFSVSSPSAVPESTSAGFLSGISLVILGMWKRARSRNH